MPVFVELRAGSNAANSRLIAASCCPDLIRDVASRMARESHHQVSEDPVLAPIDQGRAESLRRLAARSDR